MSKRMTRGERISTLHGKLDDKKPVEIEKFRAEASIKLDVTESKVQEYIDQLEKADFIDVEEGEVVEVYELDE